MNDIGRLYRDTIKQHAADPVGYRQEIDATHQYEEYNPLCGDRILVQLRIADKRVEAAAFDGEACAICMASASLLCDNTPGHPVSRLEDLHDRPAGGSREQRRNRWHRRTQTSARSEAFSKPNPLCDAALDRCQKGSVTKNLLVF